MKKHYEEEREIPPVMGWLLLFVLAGTIIAWCMALMMLIPDQPRNWDFGAFPDTPAASIYSTNAPPPVPSVQPAPDQITPLPESKKWVKPEKAGESEYIDFPQPGAGK